MKVLWLSDAGCTTGFGRVTHSIGERLMRDYGHDIHVLAVNHKGDSYPSLLDPTKQTPLHLYLPTLMRSDDLYGKSRIVELLDKIHPDMVVTLDDPQVVLQLLFENEYDPKRYLLQYRPIISYLPVDGTNLPPAWPEILPKVTDVVAMSKHGQSLFPGAKLAYHGIDVDQWWPVTEKPITVSSGAVLRSKKDCKKAFGFNPKGFLVGRIDSNSGRKDYPASWKALVPVMKRHPEVEAHFHCAASNARSGIRINAMLSREPDVADRFHTPDLHTSFAGWPQQDMNALMNAFDCFLSTSRGEGFGLSLAEAGACAVPVIAQNVSAIPEVVGPGGILIEPAGLITVPSGEDTWLPDIGAFTKALEYLIESHGARRDLGRKGLEHARTAFNWDETTALFNGFLEDNHGQYLAMAAAMNEGKNV